VLFRTDKCDYSFTLATLASVFSVAGAIKGSFQWEYFGLKLELHVYFT
jgi:hypothetical protein